MSLRLISKASWLTNQYAKPSEQYFTAPFLCLALALFWKRSNKYGAISGMVVGGVMVFVWKYVIRPLGGAWDIYELLPAFICASVAIVLVSLLTKAPEKEIVDEFEEVVAMK